MTDNSSDSKAAETDFGFERLPWHEKKARVRGVFDSVASRYDLMNDLMSFGLHRLWKRFTVSQTGLRAGATALDVAAGTADLSIPIARRVGPSGRIVVTDINMQMLELGRDRMIDGGLFRNTEFLLADAEALPLRARQFDCVTIGFGLRNVTDKKAALREMYRVLRPGGKLLILEFSKPQLGPLGSVYDKYSFEVLPRIGQAVANDADSYRYLAESIRKHPAQDELVDMLREQGFDRVEYFNLSGGIVALHVGYRT